MSPVTASRLDKGSFQARADPEPSIIEKSLQYGRCGPLLYQKQQGRPEHENYQPRSWRVMPSREHFQNPLIRDCVAGGYCSSDGEPAVSFESCQRLMIFFPWGRLSGLGPLFTLIKLSSAAVAFGKTRNFNPGNCGVC